MTNRKTKRNRLPKPQRDRGSETPAQPSTPSGSLKGKKGIFTEYIDRAMSPQQLIAERQKQLKRISELRDGRAVLAYAADFQKQNIAPISIDITDLTPLNDQITVLEGTRLDFILETPGGAGEIAEDIVKLLRSRFDEVNIIVPGTAKSAGTIIAMAGDEILMEPVSALGPIDAQIIHRGKQFSAEAFIQGLDDIKEEAKTKGLNPAHIPILQNISPGEIRHAENAMEFARELVREWLVKYKFKNWTHRRRDGSEVTDADRRARAKNIADELSKHKRWLTHGRSIKIDDLRAMEVMITDYSENAELADAIRRYRVLVEMTFSEMQAYKLFETPTSFIMRVPRQLAPQKVQPQVADAADIELECANCKNKVKFVLGFGRPAPKKTGYLPFPKGNIYVCPKCSNKIDIGTIRKQLEAQTGKQVY
jgi:hypothetical protein